ncbi:DUF3016 domain-containing protein [Roseomonas hellenica]|uniref:DUF3016 domain-containing protein n=1 Tax=Plastoroseomonas hellenica TaxID=2687306 RepID=A0ABS5F6W0_9PROT|nr:DUF3016 domain-containing protein [Plastoroseomonas hellenica]MBR0668302.1 DUF3016 domain-containing protein [Plastoroseomonas hellenica]
MRMLRSLALGGAALLAAGGARAEVTVSFLEPGRYTDANLATDRPVGADAPALQALRRQFERLGRRLPPGRSLRIEILDVDLAGRFEPWRVQAPNLRVMTGATWPRLRLRYVLEGEGRVLARGEEDVTDRTYLDRGGSIRSGDRLPYEERMLEDWFAWRIARVGSGT